MIAASRRCYAYFTVRDASKGRCGTGYINFLRFLGILAIFAQGLLAYLSWHLYKTEAGQDILFVNSKSAKQTIKPNDDEEDRNGLFGGGEHSEQDNEYAPQTNFTKGSYQNPSGGSYDV